MGMETRMAIASRFSAIEKRFAWSFLGFVLAVIFGGIALYTEFFRNSNPAITYRILANTRILDVKEDVGGLAIVYNSEDIRKSHKTLSVLTLRVGNEGRSAILKNSYDSASPLGFALNSGEIIKGEVIDASTPYLRTNAKLTITDPKVGEFAEVIIEPREWFTVKCLVLNPEDTALSVIPQGKVAGAKSVILIDQLPSEAEDSFLTKVVAGSVWVQVVRVPVYLLGFVLAVVLVFAPIAVVSNRMDVRYRRKIISQFKTYSGSKYDALNGPVYEFYMKYGLPPLVRLRQIVVDDGRFSSSLKSYTNSLNRGKSTHADEDVFVGFAMGAPPHVVERFRHPGVLFRSLVDLGIVIKEKDGFGKDKEKVVAMCEFIEFALIKET
jgi:hypothetical protein